MILHTCFYAAATADDDDDNGINFSDDRVLDLIPLAIEIKLTIHVFMSQ